MVKIGAVSNLSKLQHKNRSQSGKITKGFGGVIISTRCQILDHNLDPERVASDWVRAVTRSSCIRDIFYSLLTSIRGANEALRLNLGEIYTTQSDDKDNNFMKLSSS